MGYAEIPYDRRLKENIRNYSLSNLYDMEIVKSYLKNLAKMLEINILVTDRHGEKEIVIGDSFMGFRPDVEKEPGRKLRVQDRTVGHVYIKPLDQNRDECLINEMVDGTLLLLEKLGEEVYLHREGSIYLEEVEKQLEDHKRTLAHDEREDVLTGVFNKIYLQDRMKVIDRSEIIPVAVINVNINDWKFVNDHYGDDESDRLIKIVVDILKEEAKPCFDIGRMGGDSFIVLIPMAQEGEAEEYVERIRSRCDQFEDPILAPSIAVGAVYKTNIEETIEDRISDAEYEMFNNKFEVKNAPGYRERLEKGLHR